MRALVVFAVIAATGHAAQADDDTLSHKGQFGASVRLGVGVRAIATYENKHYCGTTDSDGEFGYASVCTGRMPFTLNLEGSWGVSGKAELVLELRIGLESDFGTTPTESGPHLFQVAPGARFLFSDSARGKAFVQPALMLDFTDYGGGTGNDIGVRGIEGYWMDFTRTLGGYVYVGETLGLSRWLSAAFEAGVGVQVRR